MGFLEDLGRTNTAYSVGRDLLRGSQELARIQMQAPQQQFRNALAVKQLQMQQNEENMKMAEYNRQIEKEEKFLPATLFGFPADQNKFTESQKKLVKELTDAKLAEVNNGVLGIRQKNAPFVKEYFNKYPDRLLSISVMKYKELADQLEKAKSDEDKKAILEQMNILEGQIKTIHGMTNYKDQQTYAPKGYSDVKTDTGIYPFNKDTGTLGPRLGGLPPTPEHAWNDPNTIEFRKSNQFTKEYTARMNKLKADIRSVLQAAGLTKTEIMRVSEGDTAILTDKMTPEQIRALEMKMGPIADQMDALDAEYEAGLRNRTYRWGIHVPKPAPKNNDPLGLR